MERIFASLNLKPCLNTELYPNPIVIFPSLDQARLEKRTPRTGAENTRNPAVETSHMLDSYPLFLQHPRVLTLSFPMMTATSCTRSTERRRKPVS